MRGFQSGDGAIGRWDADRASTVGTEGKGHKA